MVKGKSRVKGKRKSTTIAPPEEEPVAAANLIPLISQDEWYAREQRHYQRIQDVKVCLGFISESIEDYNRLLKKQSKEEHWDRYMRCDGLPRVQEPADLRRFIYEIKHFEKLNEESVVNWALSIDERSILTQDIEAKDMTRHLLEQELRPNIGKFYDDAVERILITLKRIDLLQACKFEMDEISAERAVEISLIRGELIHATDELFDKLTYRIICIPNSYKTRSERVTEGYCYAGVNFKFEVWWLPDVPMRFTYFEHPFVVAKLSCMDVNVQIPMCVICDNLTIRCIHTYYDPYSENAKSYSRNIEDSPNELNAGLTDIEDCLINEWIMQVTIMSQMITRMEQKLIIYEEYKRETQIRMAQAAKKDNFKPIKLPKEPQRLPDDQFPDPYKTFLQQEQQEFDDFLEQYLSPQFLKLQPDEINLRRYTILGGIYSLFFVQKPKNTDFPTFNRTFHDEDRLLHTRKHVRAFADVDKDDQSDDYDDNNKKSNTTIYENRSGTDFRNFASVNSQKSNNFARSFWLITHSPQFPHSLNYQQKDNDLNYFHVSIKLPKDLCRYGDPLACQYLDEFVDVEGLDEEIPVSPDESRGKKKRKKSFLGLGGKKPDQISSDSSRMGSINMEMGAKKIPSKKAVEDEPIYELARPRTTNIMPKLSTANNIYRPPSRNSPRSLTLRHSLQEVVLRNFDLNKGPMETMQMHEMIRHCMPRILSSFKFPQEFKMEKIEALIERTKGNKILRRNQQVVGYTDEPEYLSYDKQEAPERLYPTFDWREKVLYEQSSTPDETSSNSDLQIKIVKVDQIDEAANVVETNHDSMYGVIQTLEKIQRKYRDRALKLVGQSNFLVKRRSRSEFSSPVASGKSKSTVRISTIGSKLVHIPRLSRGQARFSNIDTISFDSIESPPQSISSVVSVGYRHGNKSPREPVEETSKKPVKVNVKHWTTKHIVHSEFNRDTLTFTIKTDRLGLFGFAFKRYEHFPFRDWKLNQNEEQPNEIIFTLDTFHVRIILYITNAGIRGYVTKIIDEYVANPVKYMEIKEPISDLFELRRRFLEKNINIFAEHDACYYIENGYFSEKHLSSELHIYDAFAVHCKLIKFYHCDWNRLAPRRDLILCLRNPKDLNESAAVTVRVTPDSSTFVEVSEPCSLDLDEITLHYQLTWRNIGTYSDLHQLINSMYPQATDVRNRDPKLIHYIRTLFTEVRPISFS